MMKSFTWSWPKKPATISPPCFHASNSPPFWSGGHGARLVTLHEADPTAYETQMLYYKDLIGTKLPFGFAGTWGAYVQGIVLLAVGALVLVGAGVTVLVVRLVKKSRNKRKAT